MAECKAVLYIADDYGDNVATIRCQREAGHEGEHEELFQRKSTVRVTWSHDEANPRKEVRP